MLLRMILSTSLQVRLPTWQTPLMATSTLLTRLAPCISMVLAHLLASRSTGQSLVQRRVILSLFRLFVRRTRAHLRVRMLSSYRSFLVQVAARSLLPLPQRVPTLRMQPSYARQMIAQMLFMATVKQRLATTL